MAIGHDLFDGKASLVVGTHTHVPTNDARILMEEQVILQMLACVVTMTLLLEWTKIIQLKDFLKKMQKTFSIKR